MNSASHISRVMFRIARTLFYTALLGVSAAIVSAAEPETRRGFDFDEVVKTAREAASRPYVEPEQKIPEFLLDIDYDQWRDIRFQPEHSLWRKENLSFEVQFFHAGFFYNRVVSIFIVENNQVRPFQFSKQFFRYGNNEFAAEIPENLGFAGFRLHYPLNRKDYLDETLVFLGASYFRAVAENLNYGLSARGLAIDTASEKGEEFPYFKTFWLVKPASGAKEITIFALLDSESVAGAYKFVIQPGARTQMQVTTSLFFRKAVSKLGVAPLTSMYFYSETTNLRPVDDFRPEVHDSDGLLLAYPSGEFVWRPLVNYSELFINVFSMPQPAGFGLIQRDLDFEHYQDLEARYDRRPSVWVKPAGEWGPGRVELIQIPTKSEKNDNIVTFWSPKNTPGEQESLHCEYSLIWYAPQEEPRHELGYVAATRTAPGKDDAQRKFIIDFTGGQLARLPAKLPADAPLESVIEVQGKGQIVEKQLYRNQPLNGWRLVFLIELDEESTLEKVVSAQQEKPPIEIRAYLKQGQTVLTETWSYAVWL